MNEEINNTIEKREKQIDDLKAWLLEHIGNKGLVIQVNFSIKNTTEHKCVTVSGAKMYNVADIVIDAMEERIEYLKSMQ